MGEDEAVRCVVLGSGTWATYGWDWEGGWVGWVIVWLGGWRGLAWLDG